MKVVYRFLLLVLAVFCSALISSLILQVIGGTGFVLEEQSNNSPLPDK